MAKYKLLKDLPTFKAGDIFYISQCGDLMHDGGNVGIMAYARHTLDMFPDILTEWFEEVQESTDSIHWKPKNGDNYYYIVYSYNPLHNEILVSAWIDDDHDKAHYLCGNIYRSYEEAEKARNRKLAEVRLRRTSTFEPDWEDGLQKKFVVIFNHVMNRLEVHELTFEDLGLPAYFDDEVTAMRTIRENREDWLAYFGIEEKK